MTSEEYDRLSIPYQVLTKRFYENQTYYNDGFYRCYNPKHYIVRDKHLEQLKRFTELSYRDIYTEEYINAYPFGDTYLDSKLVKIEEKRVCLSTELGQVFLYLLVSKLKKGITQYVELIKKLQDERKGLIKSKNDGNTVVIPIFFLESIKGQFEIIDNYKFVFHLLAKTNSGFLMRDWNSNIEVNLNRISGLLDSVKNFDFSKIND
ncbi:hypothetical protein [Psychroserpens algicola]|uniref:hypothetical protein n=1 Tax=Psychroserpens algicola TaxID=1719034 RepID=UPI001953F812|nr:hypothetical protein [Psychroserpens algicola]